MLCREVYFEIVPQSTVKLIDTKQFYNQVSSNLQLSFTGDIILFTNLGRFAVIYQLQKQMEHVSLKGSRKQGQRNDWIMKYNSNKGKCEKKEKQIKETEFTYSQTILCKAQQLCKDLETQL